MVTSHRGGCQVRDLSHHVVINTLEMVSETIFVINYGDDTIKIFRIRWWQSVRFQISIKSEFFPIFCINQFLTLVSSKGKKQNRNILSNYLKKIKSTEKGFFSSFALSLYHRLLIGLKILKINTFFQLKMYLI